MEKIQRRRILRAYKMVLCVKFSQLSLPILTLEKGQKKLFIRNQTIDIFNPHAPPEKEIYVHGKGTKWVGTFFFFCLSQFGSWIRNLAWHIFLPFVTAPESNEKTKWELRWKKNEKRTWFGTIICVRHIFFVFCRSQIIKFSRIPSRWKKLLKTFFRSWKA